MSGTRREAGVRKLSQIEDPTVQNYWALYFFSLLVEWRWVYTHRYMFYKW